MDDPLDDQEDEVLEDADSMSAGAAPGWEEDAGDLPVVAGSRLLDKEGIRKPAAAPAHDDDLFLLLERDDAGGGVSESLSVPVRPRTGDEFVCRSCYLVKNRSQLVDSAREVCLDCAA